MSRPVLIACPALLLLAGCPTSIDPIAPVAEIEPAPERDLRSMLQLPVKINLAPVLSFLKGMVPHDLWSPGWHGEGDDTGWNYQDGQFAPRDHRYRFHTWQTSSVRTLTGPDFVELDADFAVRLDAQTREKMPFGAYVGGFCDGVPVHAKLRIAFDLKNDWSLVSTRTVDVHSGPCVIQVLFWGRDLRPQIEAAFQAQLVAQSSKMVDAMQQLDVRGRVEHAWHALSATHQIDDQYQIALRPEAVIVRHPVLHGTELDLAVGVIARPEVGRNLASPPASPLPPFAEGEVGGAFYLEFDGNIYYSSIAQELERVLRKQLLDGDKKIVVKHVGVQAGPKGTLAVRAEVSGDFEGNIYVLARPELQGEALTFHDVKLTIETSDLLGLIFAKQFEEMLSTRIKSLSIRLEPVKSRVKALAMAALNGGSLHGDVTGVSVSRVWVGRDSLGLRCPVTAYASASLQPDQIAMP